MNNKISAVNGNRLSVTLRLNTEERKMLDAVCEDLGYSQAKTFRTIISEAFERHQEERNRTRLEEIDSKVSVTKSHLEQLAARLENTIAILRSFEIATNQKLDDISAPVNATAVRLLAVVRSAGGRDKIEAEIQNIIKEG